MKTISSKIFIFAIIFTISCSHKEKEPKEYFKKVFNIESNKLNVDTYKINSFGRIIPFENQQLLIKENYMGESLLDQIYYTKDSIRSFAQIGSGPDEYIMLRLMQKANSEKLKMLDIQKKQIITKDLNGNTSNILNLQQMPLAAIQINDKYIISGLMNRDENDDKRYAILNSKGEYIKSFGSFPNDKNESEIKSRVLAYQDYMVCNPSMNRFATVCSSGAIFELYQIDTTPQLIKSYHDIYPVYINDSRPGYNSIRHGKENIIGYTDIYATDKYIYALYSGKKLEVHNNEGMMNAKLTNDIFIYNWDGERICRLVSDVKLFNLCVTDDNQKLIALGWKDDFNLYSFDLSSINIK